MQFILLFSTLTFLLSVFFVRAGVVALVAEVVYLIWRGFILGRLPLVGPHDTLIFLSASTVGFGMVVALWNRQKVDLLRLLFIMAFVLSTGGLLSRRVDTPLPGVLQTYWFELHVVLSFLSYGLFGVSTAVSFTAEPDKRARLQYLTAYVGYILFSLSMVFGGIWAYFAWGTYWLWTPKEIWTTILWLTYTLYLHMRLLGNDYKSLSIWLGRIGYLVVLFTYLGVGFLMKSSHSF